MNRNGGAEDALNFLRDAKKLQRRGFRWHAQTLHLALRLAEMTSVFLAGLLATAAVPSSLGAIPPHWAVFAAAASAVAALEISRPRPAESRAESRAASRAASRAGVIIERQVAAACVTGVAILLLSATAWRADLGWGIGELVGTAALLTSLHTIYTEGLGMLDADGKLATHVAILGTGPVAQRLQAEFATDDRLAIKVVGVYAATDAQPARRNVVRGSLRTLISDCRLGFVDAIVLAPEPGNPESGNPESGNPESGKPESGNPEFGNPDTLAGLRRSLRACIQDIYLAPELAPERMAPSFGIAQAKLGVVTLPLLSRRPITGTAALAKRAFDIVGALGLIAFMAPLLGLVALAIAADSRGPILFRQLRVGYNNQLFYVLKFRSMYNEAADRLAKQQTVQGDTRITKVGHVIRKLSLDELPQLFNVLRGEMSLVGPRPHAPGTSIGGQRVHTIVEDYACRHLVRPGITGLAQVRGLRGGLHNRRQVAERVAVDLEYIERWSIWLDIRILLGTVVLELRDGRGS